MPYLAIKKVKGRYYGYMQESFREGGKVRTRTVEYLGAIEPAVAQQYQATRSQLTGMEMGALVQAVRDASASAIRAPQAPREDKGATQATAGDATPSQPLYKRMTVNGRPQLVNTRTGELFEPQDSPEAQAQTRASEPEVITTDKPTLRPFADGLKLPKGIETHKLDRRALHGTHRKFGDRLAKLRINPAAMPDIIIRYKAPDSMRRQRNGGYLITASRDTSKAHSINKTALWRNYRHALASATLDAIEAERPELFAQLESQLSESKKEGKRLLFTHIAQTTSGAERLGLSLQLMLWDRMPAPRPIAKKGGRYKGRTYQTNAQSERRDSAARNLGQMSHQNVSNWRDEAATILAAAHKDGWDELTDKTARTVGKHKATITKKRREIDGLSRLDKLAGKKRKLLREILTTETKLKAAEELAKRQATLRQFLDP